MSANKIEYMEPPHVPKTGRTSNFIDLLEIVAWEAAPGRARLECVVLEKHLRSLNIIHGGVYCALLDTVIGIAADTQAPVDHYLVTVQLNVNFIRPAWLGERLVATAEIQHTGRQTSVGRGEIRTSEGALCGTASGTFMHIQHSKDTRGGIEKRPDQDVANSLGQEG